MANFIFELIGEVLSHIFEGFIKLIVKTSKKMTKRIRGVKQIRE